MTRTFICAGCCGVFVANNTEEERDAEAAELYAGTADEEQVSCCDYCHMRILEMIKADPGRVEADVAQKHYVNLMKRL